MAKSAKDVLDQVERECERARGLVTQVENLLDIARYELGQTMRQGERDNGDLYLEPLMTRLNRAVDRAASLWREIGDVEKGVDAAR